MLEAGDRGELGIWRREEDHWVRIIPWTRSEVVRPGGAPNVLPVRAVCQRLTFLVNGPQVAGKANSVLPEGAAGIFVGGDLSDVILDRLLVRAPD